MEPTAGPPRTRWESLTLLRTLVVAGLFHVAVATVVSYKFDWHISGLIRFNLETADAHADKVEPGIVALTQSTGFDGKEHYLVAVDPFPDRTYPTPYRLKRILYPLASFALACGRKPWLPFTMFAVNLLAVLAGTFFLGRILQIAHRPPILALIYSASIGEIVGVKYSLTTPLALAFAIGGVYFWRKGRPWSSAAFFSLSLLANEYTLLIPFFLGAHGLIVQRRWRESLALVAAPLVWGSYLLFIVHRYTVRAVSDASAVLAPPLEGILALIRHMDPSPPWRHFIYADITPLVIAALAIIVAVSQLRRLVVSPSPYPLMILSYLALSLFLKEDAWRMINISRYLSAVFPLMLVGSVENPTRGERLAGILSVGLSVASFVGILVEPRVPFILWRTP